MPENRASDFNFKPRPELLEIPAIRATGRKRMFSHGQNTKNTGSCGTTRFTRKSVSMPYFSTPA